MSDNPYESPKALDEVRPALVKKGVISWLASAIVLGTFAGAVAMFSYSFFMVTPPWGPRLLKGDPRWETILFNASTLLPISIFIGIGIAAVALRFVTFRLGHVSIVLVCLGILFFISSQRPYVSRVRRPDRPTPAYEWVPDTLCRTTGAAIALTLVSAAVNRWFQRKSLPTPLMVSEPDLP